MRTICYRNVDWIVGWDADQQRHCYHRGADLAFAGEHILHAGPGSYAGHVDEEIPGAGLFLMPGLVNIHVHSASMPTFRGVREDMGNPNFYFSGVYEGWGLFMPPPAARRHTTRLAICEMLLSGVTTYVDMSYPYPGWVDAIAETGIRAVVSPLYESARVVAKSDHALEYRWSEDGGEAAFAEVIELLDGLEASGSDRMTAMMSPMTLDTCTPELLKKSHDLALERGWVFHLHAGMSVVEFLEMVQRTGLTSVQWLESQGLLGNNTILGHGAVLDHHSWVHWHTSKDIDILARTGTSVSHCPVVLSRYGMTLESLGRYRKAGITVGIGTDCHPHNMIEEIREAAILSRVAEQHMFSTTTTDAFDTATVGGALAIHREDIGRLTPGAKADIVVVDATHPMMLPLYDPIRSLIYSAGDRAVRDVWIGGRQIVRDGAVLTVDHQKTAEAVGEVQAEVVADMPNRDRKSRTAEEVSPRTYAVSGGQRG